MAQESLLPRRTMTRDASRQVRPLVLFTVLRLPFIVRSAMPRIFLLPDEVASQVAAGEVIERPASVVKELVENSIDAEARRIEVAILRGGTGLIRVIDDGIGMDRDDALLSLERHATSKIRSGHDLAKIHTLGFRGEALPSIASICRFRMSTRPDLACCMPFKTQ
jgi:DNA mismatch repair protein MutL